MPKLGVLFLFMVGQLVGLHASPRLPASDSAVIERIPNSVASPGLKNLKSLKRNLEKDPDNVELATAMAREYLVEGKRRSDPRFYGYAEAALAPWWKQGRPPVSVQLLRAILRQSNHDFKESIKDLNEVISRDPGNAQAWLSRAAILRVMGKYSEARDDCNFLRTLRNLTVGDVCLQQVRGLTGEAEPALIELRKLILLSSQQSVEIFSWAVGSAAEIAYRLGDAKQAEILFSLGVKQNPEDIHLLIDYADFLLEQGRGKELIKYLEGRTEVDGLLLRLVLAEKQAGAPNDSHRAMLEQRFAAARARGTAIHGREEAIFLFKIKGDPKAALTVALQNWELQREPIDLKIALESAIAAGDEKQAKELRGWAASHRLQAFFLKPE